MKTARLDAVQYLRAIAALLVVVGHTIDSVVDPTFEGRRLVLFANLMTQCGVWMFFVISGFIMVYTSQPRDGQEVRAGEFLWKRIARIVPLYWLTSTVYLVRIATREALPSAGTILAAYLFFPVLDGNGFIAPFYGVGWTLNYEMFFYALFAASLLLGVARGSVVLVVVLGALVALGQALPLDLIDEPWRTALRFWTHPVMLYFAAGILLAHARLALERRGRRDLLVFRGAIVLVLALPLGLVALGALDHPSAWLAWRAPVAVGAVALAVFVRDAAATPVHRLVVLLGEASFSIYLTHSFVVGPMARWWDARYPLSTWPLLSVFTLIGASLLGYATYRWAETPLTRWATALRQPRRGDVPAVQGVRTR